MSVQSDTIKTVSKKSAAAGLSSQMLIPKSDQEFWFFFYLGFWRDVCKFLDVKQKYLS